MARVLAPGGVLVLTDSVQSGDRPILDGKLGYFARINEQHYENYKELGLSQPWQTKAGWISPEGGLGISEIYMEQFKVTGN